MTLSHPDPIREIAATKAREAARVASLGTFTGARKADAKAVRREAATPFEGAFACFIVLAVIVACLMRAGGVL